MTEAPAFSYVAIDPAGRRVRGSVAAPDERLAFETLKRDGLSPVTLRRGRAASVKTQRLADAETADLLFELSALLRAGADLKAALGIAMSGDAKTRRVRALKRLDRAVSGGEGVAAAFAEVLPRDAAFVMALVKAGETGGDLASAFERASRMLRVKLELRKTLIETCSYPAFVAASAFVALLVILLFVVPSLEPLASSALQSPPLIMRGLFAMSRGLREHAGVLIGGLVGLGLGLIVALRSGGLEPLIDRAFMTGPWRSVTNALVYGRFAQLLGQLLASGVTGAEAMRIAETGVSSALARQRLSKAAHEVRQGAPLSTSLAAVPGFPDGITRLSVIGEQTGSLGMMLERAGSLEIERTMKAVKTAAAAMGPVLIVLLGGLIGLLMAGLLTGVSSLGDAALG